MAHPGSGPVIRTRMRLHRRVQLAAFGLAMLLATIIGITDLALAWRDLPRGAQAANQTLARLLGSYLNTAVNHHVDELRQLAESSLVWTALSDSQGRDIYIKPFIDDRNHAMPFGRIALLDYKGRFIAGQLRDLPGYEAVTSALVQEILASGKAKVEMATWEQRPILVVGVPIFYVYTEDVIGVLLGSYDLAGILGRQSIADLVNHGVRLQQEDRVWTLWPGDQGAAAGIFAPAVHAMGHEDLPGLYALGLEVYSTHNPWLPLLLARTTTLFLVSMLLAVVIWWLAGVAARRVSGRLEALAAAILAHPIPGAEDIPGDEVGDEISVLGGALRQALSAHAQAQEELRQLAYYDPLTGLMNRALFEDKLADAMRRSQRHDEGFALLFIDLDRFKVVNDTAGHEAGDLLLREVASRIRGRVRASDLACRRSGDEFTVLMEPCAGEDEAAKLAMDLIQRLSQPVRLPSGASVAVGASIGIALFPQDGAGLDELLANADAAMYAAKESGAGRYCFYAGGAGRAVHDRLRMESALRQALLEERLELVYQPQYALADGHLRGFEALTRWQEPRLGEVSPRVFIPLAGATGLIARLCLWQLRRACAEMAACPAARRSDLVLAINILPSHMNPDFIHQVQGVLAESGWPPARLELELTEADLMRAPVEVWATLAELRQLGITLAMDDFGGGYSRQGYLRQLSVGRLKLDPSLIQDLMTLPAAPRPAAAVPNTSPPSPLGSPGWPSPSSLSSPSGPAVTAVPEATPGRHLPEAPAGEAAAAATAAPSGPTARTGTDAADAADGLADGGPLEALITIAHRLGLQVVAEGVERQEQREALRRLGCDLAQGFLLGEPVDAAGLRRLCAGRAGPGEDREFSR